MKFSGPGDLADASVDGCYCTVSLNAPNNETSQFVNNVLKR